MKIALLNLQYDNNYGGNLQRYALMTILQRMGHDVTHLNLRSSFENSFFTNLIKIPKRFLKKILKDSSVTVFSDAYLQERYNQNCSISDPFYNRYIKHTDILTSKNKLVKYIDYDAFIVGSDQVWRKDYAELFGIDTFFFDWIPDNKPRLGYAVSLGTETGGFSSDDIVRLGQYYSKFTALSVREKSALDTIKQYGWNNPKPEWVLDPTLLLSKEDYLELIFDGSTLESSGDMFCYILDPNEEKDSIIQEEAKRRNLKPFNASLNGKRISIQQWVRSFYDSKFIVTDSYHGLLFSLIFNKPFRLIRNMNRGNARFDSIFEIVGFSSNLGDNVDWDKINIIISSKRFDCINWLNNNFTL